MSEKIKVAALFGPTASGKTKLSVSLAKRFGGEIVSADSMQIYKGMDIGTAKPSENEKCGIPHHLVDFQPPDEPFSVALYVKLAKKCILDIQERGKLPIIAGGTGLYIRSLLRNIEFPENGEETDIRCALEARAAEDSNSLYEELMEIDPEYAKTFHSNNVKRVIRALELYKTCGITMTQQYENSRKAESPYNALKMAIVYRDRQVLYDRINRRVDEMIENGLIAEAQAYFEKNYTNTSSQAIGYKELYPYFKGEISLPEATENIKMSTRRYAKRQLTWIRREENINELYADDGFEKIFGEASDLIEKHIKGKAE